MKKSILILLFTFVLISCKSGSTNKSGNNIIKGANVDKLMDLKSNEMLVAKISTTMGDIEIELYPSEAPKTVKNFSSLANKGFYNGVIFHRVIKNFMIQGGDPTGTGRGGTSIYGGPFEDEFSVNLRHDAPGVLSMANAGPNTNQSQFFITTVATPWLDARHTVFGKVIKGMNVVSAISEVETNPMDKPLQDVVMKNVVVEKRTK
ncbi:MAG: peptidylprolyl isomerase [Bacteroidota bacterium]